MWYRQNSMETEIYLSLDTVVERKKLKMTRALTWFSCRISAREFILVWNYAASSLALTNLQCNDFCVNSIKHFVVYYKMELRTTDQWSGNVCIHQFVGFFWRCRPRGYLVSYIPRLFSGLSGLAEAFTFPNLCLRLRIPWTLLGYFGKERPIMIYPSLNHYRHARKMIRYNTVD